MPKVVFENEVYNGADLASEELALLQKQIDTMFTARGSFYEELLKENFQKIVGALMVAKEYFKAPFTGMSAGDGEIGLQKIRSGHFRRTTAATEAADNDWTFAFTAGNDYWVGRDTNNTTAANIDKEVCVLILGVMFTQGAQPVVEEMYWQVGGTTYPVEVIRDAWTADNDFGVRGIPIRPKLLVPKATVLTQTRQTIAGTNELVALGVTFGLGRYLRSQSYSAISL